jgi:hypothetical protein
MKLQTSMAAVVTLLTLPGCVLSGETTRLPEQAGSVASSLASPAATVKGHFFANATQLCNYTATSQAPPPASNNQRAGVSGTYYFDGAGTLKIDVHVNSFNVPMGTRSTSTNHCEGSYEVQADNVVTTNIACTATVDEGFGAGNVQTVPAIHGRFLKVGNILLRAPSGPPFEEQINTTTPAGVTTTTYRKCSRMGALNPMPGSDEQ